MIGLAVALVATRLLPRLPEELAPFAPVASVGTAAIAYGAAAGTHASGFLSVYIVALAVGNTPMPLRRTIVSFHEGLAFLAQVVLFIVLGLLVFPSHLGRVAWEALALTAVLLLAARPLAVLVSMLPFRFGAREQAFLSWAGLRGAVPIVLATFALSAHVPDSGTIFNTVFFVVLVSTLAQGMTLEPLAKRLRLTTEPRQYYDPPVEVAVMRDLGGEILEFEVGPGDAVAGVRVRDLGLPHSSLVMLIVRGDTGIPPRGSTKVEPDDRLYVFARGAALREVEASLERWRDGPLRAEVTEGSGAARARLSDR